MVRREPAIEHLGELLTARFVTRTAMISSTSCASENQLTTAESVALATALT
jgi:hypothetical protein